MISIKVSPAYDRRRPVRSSHPTDHKQRPEHADGTPSLLLRLKPPRSPLREERGGNFNISIMFYRSKVLDYGIDENLNICYDNPIVPSAFTDVSSE